MSGHRRDTPTQAIVKRLNVLDALLGAEAGLYPPHCDCVIKSRVETHHLPECPYRQLKELSRDIRRQFSRENGNG